MMRPGSDRSAPLGIVCDFDGTITTDDVAVTLLRTFTPEVWEQPIQDFLAGRIDVEELLKLQFSRVRVSQDELIAYALAHIGIRSGFAEFVRFCQERGIALVVASAGMEFYIRAFLERAGVDVPELVCGRAHFTPEGVQVSYDHLERGAGESEMDLKERAVERLRTRGCRVVYIGDGLPDLRAAQRSDVVFARDRLAEACQEHGIAYRPFADFYGIMAALTAGLTAVDDV